jgi:pimeloyl-ACP methyl ester carboxylesterase
MPTEGWIDLGPLRLHYLDWGGADRPTVVFLHGSAAHAHWWDFVLPLLAERYRCLALDLRGHGDSGVPDNDDYTIATHAGDVARLLATLGVRRTALVGHSFGGLVAMQYAASTESRLGALVVIDSRIGLGSRSVRFLEALRRFPPPRYTSFDDAVARFRLLPAATTASESVLRHMACHAVVASGDGSWRLKGTRRALGGAREQDLGAELGTAACPLLVVRGAHSSVVDAEALLAFARAAPQAELVEIADAHHHVMLDQPAALAGVVGAFLDRHYGVR